MKRLQFDRPINLGRLHDQLIAQVPALAPQPGAGGMLQAVMTVEGGTDRAILTVPDEADEAAIQAVVDAHDPTPDVPPARPDYGTDAADVDRQAATAVQNLRDYIALPSPTQAQTVAVVKLLCRIAVYFIRTRVG